MERNPVPSQIELTRQNNAQIVSDICKKYGIHGNVVYFAPSPISNSGRNRLYVIASVDPSIENLAEASRLRPDKIVRTMDRNHKLFYPKVWAYDLLENQNEIQAQQDLVDYCKTAEFLIQLYKEHDAQLPDKLRKSEINQLIEYRSVLDNPMADPALIKRCKKALNRFFKREKSKSKFRKNWMSYYRSEQFPDSKGALARLTGYFQRNKNRSGVKRLMEVNGDLHKLEMQEHEYKIFAKLMKEKHPDVVFAVGDKEIVDHGLLNAQRNPGPFGRAVTGEEYAVIRKDRFATEGFSAVADLRPAYWEFRNVYYKAVDEPLIAGIYNHITLSYAKCNALMELRERGEIKLERIPVTDFMNFVSLAKANNVRFYLDNDGDYETPSLDFINVLYNAHQEDKMAAITSRMISDKVEFSHLLDVKHPSLSDKLQAIRAAKQERIQSKNPPTHTR